MRKSKIFLLFLAASLPLPWMAAGNESPTIPQSGQDKGHGGNSESKKETLLAVMDIVNNTGEFGSFIEGMPDMLITELLESGDVKLVERTKVQTAMKALKIETSGLTQERNLELGKWLGVDGILFGTFNRVGDSYRLDIRAIDVITGKIKVSASTTASRQNILEMIPDIGKQLRIKISRQSEGKDITGDSLALLAKAKTNTPADSSQIEIEFKMIVAVFAEANISHQRIHTFLDNQPLGKSEVVNELNRYFLVYKGKIPAGNHTLSFVHGAVDKQGHWVRDLANQPEAYSIHLSKNQGLHIQYKMVAHDSWNTFDDFKISDTPITQ